MDISRRTFLGYAAAGVVLSAGSSMFLSGCSGSSNQNTSGPVTGNDREVVVTMTPSSEPAAGFNPLFSWGCGEHVHEPLIQSTLFTTDADMNFVNDLAVNYYSSDDGLTWTFIIRDDVRFTDGEPLTAADVAFTINGIRENEAAEADLSMVSQAEALDDVTVVLHLNKPFNALLYTLAVVGIVPEHAYDPVTYGAHPIGSGRYMLEQWDKGQQVILAANPDYYGPAPTIDRLIVVFMEEDASLAAVNAGQVDVGYTAATIANEVQPSGYYLFNCDSVDSRGISLPCVLPGGSKKDGLALYETGNAVTSNVALRRAINCGVDREAMVDRVLNGFGTAAYSVSDAMPWYNPAMEVDFNPELAHAFMTDDGWSLGEDGIYAKDDMRAEFDLYYAASDSVRQGLAHEFANQMQTIGIAVQPKGAGWDEIYSHEYDTPVLWGWGSNSPIELYMLHYSSSTGNYAVYDNEQVDAHLDAALAQPTIKASYQDWQLAQWDGSQGFAPMGGASWVWLTNINHLYFAREGLVIAKQKPHPHGHGWSLVNNINEWYWE